MKSTAREQDRDLYAFDCPQCNQSWSGNDLTKIAKRVAWHWNEKHGSDLKNHYERIDTVERGGHHLHGNEYAVERIHIYITAFDVMKRIGLEDGFAVLSENKTCCKDCKQIIYDEENATLVRESPISDEWLCKWCEHEQEVERKKEENRSLDSF